MGLLLSDFILCLIGRINAVPCFIAYFMFTCFVVLVIFRFIKFIFELSSVFIMLQNWNIVLCLYLLPLKYITLRIAVCHFKARLAKLVQMSHFTSCFLFTTLSLCIFLIFSCMPALLF